MSIGQIILGILLFALATVILYIWGMRKSLGQREDLERILLNRCGNRVVKYLRSHGTVSRADVVRLIDGVTAGEFWSRKRLKVQNPEKFADQVLDFLVKQLVIEAADGGYRKRQ